MESQLDSKYRLHFIDINGFAGKKAPATKPQSYIATLRDEVMRYIETQNLEHPTLVGHSMGGLIALLVASASPKSVGKIVVIDTLPFYSLLFNPNATREQVKPFAAQLEQQLLQMNEAQFKVQAQQSAAILTKSNDKAELLLTWSNTSDRHVYAQIMREVMTYDARPEIVGIISPVTVIYAVDQQMPLSKAQLYQLYRDAYANISNVELVSIENAFHFIMWDQTKAFYNRLNKVLSQSKNLIYE